jgi:hypothetical protein
LGPNLTSAIFTVLDPADVEPVSKRPLVEKLFGQRRV